VGERTTAPGPCQAPVFAIRERPNPGPSGTGDRSMSVGRPTRPGCRSASGDRHRLLDRHADHAAPLGPRSVVVADPLVADQLVEDEPRMARSLSDPAVGDDVLVGGHALRLVQVLALLARLER